MTTRQSFRNVCIVGNIASGKSTLTRLLAQEIPNSVAVLESFEQNPFLKLNFEEPQRWAFTNAVRYFYDYVRVFHEVTSGHSYAHHFIDAGAPTNRHIYGYHMFEQGLVTPQEYDFYEILCDLIANAFAYPEPDAYIFVEASPEVSFARMQVRMAEQEWQYQRPISLEYLAGLKKYFYNFQVMLQEKHVPILKFDSEAFDLATPGARALVLERVGSFLAEGK